MIHRLKWYLCDIHACGHVRGEIIARHINQRTTHEMVCKGDVLLSDIYKTTGMIWQRLYGEGLLAKMRHAKGTGIKCVYDMDDDLFSIPKDFDKAYTFYSQPMVRATIGRFLEEVDAVTVSTMELAEAIRPRTPAQVVVIENAIDYEYWNRFARPRNPGTVTIGWMASQFHGVDVPLIVEGLRHCLETYPDVRVKFIGMVATDKLVTDDLKKYVDRISVSSWVDISELPAAMADFDISLCPIIDTPFNRCKSGVKWLQAAALGIPSIVSPMAPYAHCTDGHDAIMAKGNTADGWSEAMDRLVRDVELRYKIGTQAAWTAKNRWDVSLVANEWVHLFDQLSGG